MTTPSSPARPVTVTVLPAVVNLVIYGGDHFMMRLTVSRPDGEPLDLAGSEPYAEIRRTPTDLEVAGAFTALADGGSLLLYLDGKTTRLLPSNAMWDVNVMSEGRQVTLARGTVSVTPGITVRPDS